LSYEYNKEDLYSFVQFIGSETRERGKELEFKQCPYCNGGDHRDLYTFSISIESGAYICQRSSCGRQGHFVQLCRDFNYQLPYYTAKKQYKKFPQKPIVSKDRAVEFMKSRGISEQITRKYNITTQTERENVIVFPFYDVDGKLVGAKYRDSEFTAEKKKREPKASKEWFEKDSKPVLFGITQCKDFTRLVITEGQLDSLSLAESGIDNAVSVPNGANGFSWIEHCYDWVSKFDEIVIFGDCERGKITLVDGISTKFAGKRIKVVRMMDYLGEKDANDILRKYGREQLRQAVENAEIKKINAIKDIADVVQRDNREFEKVKVGIFDVDKVLLGGMRMGQLIILQGKAGEGKSTFASQILANVVEQGYKAFAYSGELPDYQFKNWLYLQIAGRENIDSNPTDYGYIEHSLNRAAIPKIDNWLRGNLYVYDNDYIADENEPQGVLQITEQVICRYGVRFILIDNLMTALDDDMSEDLYRSQTAFVKALKQYATRYNVIILLICHPRKNGSGGNDAIAGTSNIGNLADVIMNYKRYNGGESDNNQYQSVIEVTKNRNSGIRLDGKDGVLAKYAVVSRRIVSDKDDAYKIYPCFKEQTTNGNDEEPPF
jgi:twinkle protein